MATYIILSEISPQAFAELGEFKSLATSVAKKIKSECPGVTWKQSFVTMGRFDVVDIVEADDPKQVERASMIIRAEGRSRTETMLATEWKEFLDML
ncbi:MAG: GYD domain-containing protein [Gammaproteobacteria bacterium]